MNKFFEKALGLSEIDTFVKPWSIIKVTFIMLLLIVFATSPAYLSKNISYEHGPIERYSVETNLKEKVIFFAMAVSAFCLCISFLVLIVSLPIYFWSEDNDRSIKAGKLVKSSFGFIVASGGAVVGTLSFAI